MNFLFLLRFCLFGIFITQFASAQSVLDKLADFNKKKGPGLAYFIMKEGVVTKKGVAGYADLEKKRPIQLTSKFVIASLSKQFTALTILMLENEKKIERDEYLSKYIPNLPKQMSKIRIRHLLHHQSGLPSYYEELCEAKKTPVTNKEIMDYLLSGKENLFEPGTKYQYSNTGYVVLAEVVAKVSGMSFEKYLTENVFKKLGMKNSEMVTTVTEPNYLKQMHSYTEWPHFKKDDADSCNYKHGPGSVVTTIEDYILWIKALDSNSLISEESKKQLFTPGVLDNGQKTTYAYGWISEVYKKQPMIWHNGSWLSYRSFAGYLPEKKKWVVLLSNYGGVNPTTLGDEILFED